MDDSVFDGKLVVRDTAASGPYLELFREAVPAVEAVLEAEGVRHWWTRRDWVTLDDEPPISIIFFGRNNTASLVQSALDRHPELRMSVATP